MARILGRIFAALGLLVRPEVVEAHRADLVGEHLGSTAIKTGKLIDSALGGVLFIDEAYSLYNPGYSGGDAYGAEAVATLLKRAEDDRDRLVIVLAGYTADMDRFLRSNPGLSSRFSARIGFPSYTPGELARIAGVIAEQRGDTFEPDALPVLEEIFTEAVGGAGSTSWATAVRPSPVRARVRRPRPAGGRPGGAASAGRPHHRLRGRPPRRYRARPGARAAVAGLQPQREPAGPDARAGSRGRGWSGPRLSGDRRRAQGGRRQVAQFGDEAGAVAAGVPDQVHQRVLHRMPVLTPVQQALRGLPQLGWVAAPEPVGQGQVAADVLLAGGPPIGVVVVGGQQRAPRLRAGRVQRAQIDSAERRAAPGTRTPGAAGPPGRRPAAAWPPARGPGRRRPGRGRRARRSPSSRTRRRASPRSSPGPRPAAAGPAHPGREHVRHGVLLGRQQHDLARQPVQQEGLTLAGLIRSGRPKSWSQP